MEANMSSRADLLQGIVVETKTGTLLGPCFYSDKMHETHWLNSVPPQPALNEFAMIPVVGIAAGIVRMAFAIIHIVGHLFAALFTLNKGHCFHAAKGGCEFLRGFIEAIPFAGRMFAQQYYRHGEWWIIKIYNPDSPDTLDIYTDHWRHLKQTRPSGYVTA